MKYIAVVKAKGTSFLIGGVRVHYSSKFDSENEAQQWLEAAIEINEHDGVKVNRENSTVIKLNS